MAGLIMERLQEHAAARPDAVALRGADQDVTYAALAAHVDTTARWLREERVAVLGLVTDNHPAAAIADLATQAAGACVASLPPFFSDSQMWHALRDCGADGVLTDQPQRLEAVFRANGAPAPAFKSITLGGKALHWCEGVPGRRDPAALKGMAKVTYTSGTTGQPKGALLTQDAVDTVVRSLLPLIETRPGERHMAALPLSLLLETVAGLYAALCAGAAYVVWPLAKVGLSGSSGLNVPALVAALLETEANVVISTPVVLRMLALAREMNAAPPMPALRFIGVGGAAVSAGLVERAHRVGLPAFEGYGLTEMSSVVTLNSPSGNRPGSAGKVLPHVRVAFAPDGELLLGGPSLFSGYTGDVASGIEGGMYATGDLAQLDADGYLHITGRKKNIFITAFGRNVSPEWVEREVSTDRVIGQVVVFGEAKPFNTAVIFPVPGAADADVDRVLAAVNPTLPDYARVSRWVRADAPFTPANGQLTATGKPLRNSIHAAYAERISALYADDTATGG
ncbi:hypothetical protein D7V97_06080 [Corallococcus sp. CA053C]|uniref:AMP-binding protein n=1 Tax=Corallococcus sp. CA053C TaxID=2316732 RepID=UPI000EA1335A|nr:AMP-binding protein [Corallococcus sp. CA053C]RKH13339.1 hypothetical protein D7V97_06080 [Corallococcus sp. CA053C]